MIIFGGGGGGGGVSSTIVNMKWLITPSLPCNMWSIPSDKELSHLVKLFPQVLSFTPDRIRSHVDFLHDYLSLAFIDISTLIRKHPQLLGYRLEAIHTKIDVLMAMLDLDEENMREVLLAHPVLLSLSATKRIRPRLEQAKQMGMTKPRALASLLYPEEKFQGIMDRARKASGDPCTIETSSSSSSNSSE